MGTPDKALSGECGFMAANLYAKSIFGEDALANVSLEKNPAKPDAPVTGHIRIRAKSQGMALSLGDKINTSQKTRSKKAAPVEIVTCNHTYLGKYTIYIPPTIFHQIGEIPKFPQKRGHKAY